GVPIQQRTLPRNRTPCARAQARLQRRKDCAAVAQCSGAGVRAACGDAIAAVGVWEVRRTSPKDRGSKTHTRAGESRWLPTLCEEASRERGSVFFCACSTTSG